LWQITATAAKISVVDSLTVKQLNSLVVGLVLKIEYHDSLVSLLKTVGITKLPHNTNSQTVQTVGNLGTYM
jgi:hypothetical protein